MNFLNLNEKKKKLKKVQATMEESLNHEDLKCYRKISKMIFIGALRSKTFLMNFKANYHPHLNLEKKNIVLIMNMDESLF